MNSYNSIVVAGSSITDTSAWPTWASWLEQRYQPDVFVDTSVKGLGNELILLKAVHAAQKLDYPTIIVQLTAVDKWDWHIESSDLLTTLNKEKHPIVKLNLEDSHGFWSTGCHWPLWKEYYKTNYFSLEYQTFKTLLHIQWFQMLCKQNSWKHYIFFDSPVFSVTEEQLNTGQLTKQECVADTLIQNALCKSIYNLDNFDQIYQPGLIGYACLHDLPWYSSRFKGHPGSLTHYHFMTNIIVPALDKLLPPQNSIESCLDEAVRFQTLIDKI